MAIINGNNRYVIKHKDSSSNEVDVHYLPVGTAMITNSEDVTGQAIVNAAPGNVLNVLDGLEVELPELPDNVQVNRHDLYRYENNIVRVLQDHQRGNGNPNGMPDKYEVAMNNGEWFAK